MNRRGVVGLAILGTAVVLSRIPLATNNLWAWDSVLYARALEIGFHVDFDLGGQRPHPPGYILYLAVASFLRMFLADSNAALVLISILATAIGAVALYVLARHFVGRAAAVITACGYAFSPLVWFYSEIAYPYALLGLLSILLALIFWRARGSHLNRVLLASFAFGLVSGFRQDLLLLAAPLWLWFIWPRAWRERLLAAAAVVAGTLVWLLPTAALSGGLPAYTEAVLRQGESVRAMYSVQAQGLEALLFNAGFTGYALWWGLFGFLIPLAVLLTIYILPRLGRMPGRPELRLTAQSGFFFLWIAPALVFYIVVHIGEWGYVLSVLPALQLLTVIFAERVISRLHVSPVRAWRLAAVSVVVAPALAFLTMNQTFSADAIHRRDSALLSRVSYVREHFSSERTIILAREDYLLVRYYLPKYRAWQYDPNPHEPKTNRHKRAMRTTAIVVFTQGLSPREGLDVQLVELGSGVQLTYIPINPGAVVEFSGDRYTVQRSR